MGILKKIALISLVLVVLLVVMMRSPTRVTTLTPTLDTSQSVPQRETETPQVMPTPNPTFDFSTYVTQTGIDIRDNGRTIPYIETARFDLSLDEIQYPIMELKIECQPKPLVGYISNGSCYPHCYPIMFEAAGGVDGTCTISDRDFKVYLKIYALN